jgi:hypothetical protein
MPNANKFYTIKKGDTLSEIAQRHGTTTKQLCKINGIKNPDKIGAGQIIALNAKAVCKVTVQLLDRDRNPIPNAKVRMEYSGKRKEISSKQNGRVPTILTKTPEDLVRIFIVRADGTWKQITEVASGWGNKLVTLVSPKIKLDGKTIPHPKDPSGKPVRDPKRTDKKPVKPPATPETTEAKGRPHGDFGDKKGPKSLPKTDNNGLPVKEVTNDQAELDFLKGYTGEKITEEDYKKAAKELGCEVEVIKAIGYKESTILRLLGLGSFDKKQRPVILYERHKFSKESNRKYDKTNPDISSRTPYIKGTAKKDKKPFDDGKHYGLFSWQYKKLAKAYALNKKAAICACSWGKFQVMGMNYEACGFSSPFEFAKAMSKNEREHLNAMVAFCKANNLQPALKRKTWAEIARAYNGPCYKKNDYDTDLNDIYNKYKKGEIK